MNLANNQNLNPDQSLSFRDVSKLFSFPLSEAADILGVSTNTLKKICNENGLERWPHRKYLAGKSIEDIKKEAAKEKSKALGGSSEADRRKGNVSTTAFSSPSSHIKDKTPRSAAEMSKSPSTAHQSGSRSSLTWRHHLLASGVTFESSTSLDEFEYGFPSRSLTRSINRWWGRGSDGVDVPSNDDIKTNSEVEQTSEAELDNCSARQCDEKAAIVMKDSMCDTQEKISLSIIRKRAVDEGRKARELGALKKYGVDKLGKEEMILMHRLFQTS